MSKRSRTNTGLTEIKRNAASKVLRTDQSTDPLSTKTKSASLFEEIQKWFQEKGGVGTDNDCYDREKMKMCNNVNDLVKDSKALNDLQKSLSWAINSMINDDFELLLVDNIISHLFEVRVLQLFEYFVKNNGIAFEMSAQYKYKDILNYELLYYISRQEFQSSILFDDDIKTMLSDIANQKVNMSFFVHQLLFHEPIDFDCDYPSEIDESYISEILCLQNVLKRYYDDKNWQLYSVYLPEIYDNECMQSTLENIQCYDEENDTYEMFPYCGTKYIVIRCLSEDTMIMLWGSYGMDEAWLDRNDL